MPSTVERALELARSGSYGSARDIGRQLRREKYELVNSHLAGKVLAAPLQAAMREPRVD